MAALAAAKRRVQALLGIEGQVDGSVLYAMAADEIESLRAQIEQLTADAIVRADKQARLIQAMWNIQQISLHPEYREVATNNGDIDAIAGAARQLAAMVLMMLEGKVEVTP